MRTNWRVRAWAPSPVCAKLALASRTDSYAKHRSGRVESSAGFSSRRKERRRNLDGAPCVFDFFHEWHSGLWLTQFVGSAFLFNPCGETAPSGDPDLREELSCAETHRTVTSSRHYTE